jgi:hypothetical protein
VPAPALQEGSTIDGLWGAIVPAKPASTRHGIERDRQRHKGGCCAGGVSSKSALPVFENAPSGQRCVSRFRFLILKILKFQPWIGLLPGTAGLAGPLAAGFFDSASGLAGR